MKQNDPKNPQKKNFLRIPTYPGGKKAYQKFISDNIVYPDEAMLNRTEGTVYLVYTVNNIGEIGDIEVKNGIGSGCDEEAVRVIRLMQYEPARNRGVKMKVEMKTRINFKHPENVQPDNKSGVQVNYTSATSDKTNNPEQKPRAVYNYTINLD